MNKEYILQHIDEALATGTTKVLSYDVPNVKYLRNVVYDVVRKRGVKSRVTVKLTDGVLYVIVKNKPYVERLEDMVRKMMLHVDDENLFDEALKLLEVTSV